MLCVHFLLWQILFIGGKMKKYVIGFVILVIALFSTIPIEASVDFDGKKVRVAAIEKIEPLNDSQLLITLTDDIAVANVVGVCEKLSQANRFSFVIEQSFYIRKGNKFIYWNMSNMEQECTIDSFSRISVENVA